jgi:hypothetical protein
MYNLCVQLFHDIHNLFKQYFFIIFENIRLRNYAHDLYIHTPSVLCISISRFQNLCLNISIPRDMTKLNGVGGWVDSWLIV